MRHHKRRRPLLTWGLSLATLAGFCALHGNAVLAQCYPGLGNCGAGGEQTAPPSAPSNGNAPAGTGSANSGPRTGQQAEYSFVGPVSPPDPWLALRSEPSSSSGFQKKKMPEGTPFRVLRTNGVWYFVQLQDGTTGWAHSRWIRCCKYLSN